MRLYFFWIFVFTFSAIQVLSQNEIENTVRQLLKDPDYRNASIGILVKDLDSGAIIYSLDQEKVLIPASTMKLVTSASALEILGGDYRFSTKMGYKGRIDKNGGLKGDLVLIGGADPALGSEYFTEHYSGFLENWAKQVRLAGIERVEGDLILDGSIFDSEKIPVTWIWEDIGNYYGAGPSAFTVYDNLFRITFRSDRNAGKPTEIIAVYPKIEGMEISNEVLSADNNCDNAYVFGSPLDKIRTVRGTIPKNRNSFTIKAAIHQPDEVLAKDFLQALAKEGVFVTGTIRYENVDPKRINAIFEQYSPTLEEIAKVLNYESVNLFAEHFLKQIGAEILGEGSRPKAIEVIRDFWDSKGISSEYLFMEDGSGLSHFNLVSPKFFTDMLSFMAANQSFVNSLPGAGEGTLSMFDKELFPGNTLKAKSGSMTRVRCYSGYLKTDSGKTVVFSVMVNHFSGTHSKLIGEIEKLLLTIKTKN